ncbi:MAG: peptidase M29 [Acidimicrobiaceae bacterium]|nr:peptidase M29 [Acidimicrobiaceae bacterium]MXW76802.1 peptidase M29 [Acidimicrobiaceae bacterium]MYC41846.1 peptidase M29 [Acidimicrobiaceae bacterium]MYD07724.1 peptidase M29 [Acidimicrobiaceae bacterium]MYH87187.1 peptidase M29 [Acidimicrobiaceae bacterium]
MNTQWRWVERYAEQFNACEVNRGDVAVVLTETTSNPVVASTARLALETLGAAVIDVVVTTPPNPGPVPIRSTGASQALQNNRSAVAALSAADFVADCTVEGLLHAPELAEVLASGARVLMISNEHPENVERWPRDPTLAERVNTGVELLEAAKVMKVTSAAGTDLSVRLAGAVVAGSFGWCTEPGSIAHWPGGLVLCFPAAHSVDGTVVLAPGDVNLTFKQYLRDTVELTVHDDYVTEIKGSGVDVELFRSYLSSFGEPEAYAVSHVGWGMNDAARWDAMAMWDKADFNGTELRAFAGNFLYSTGANETAERFCRGHFDLPMRSCTVTLDGEAVVVDGELVPGLRSR